MGTTGEESPLRHVAYWPSGRSAVSKFDALVCAYRKMVNWKSSFGVRVENGLADM